MNGGQFFRALRAQDWAEQPDRLIAVMATADMLTAAHYDDGERAGQRFVEVVIRRDQLDMSGVLLKGIGRELIYRAALADRDARPWRYYRFEWPDAKRFLEQLADERDELRLALQRVVMRTGGI